MKYVTMGDIAEAFRAMRDDGMARESVKYAFDQVFPPPAPVNLGVIAPSNLCRVRGGEDDGQCVFLEGHIGSKEGAHSWA